MINLNPLQGLKPADHADLDAYEDALINLNPLQGLKQFVSELGKADIIAALINLNPLQGLKLPGRYLPHQ